MGRYPLVQIQREPKDKLCITEPTYTYALKPTLG